MNRRKFFRTLSAAVAGFAILPAATTYTRTWKGSPVWIPNPEWHTAPFELRNLVWVPRWFYGNWKFKIGDQDQLWTVQP